MSFLDTYRLPQALGNPFAPSQPGTSRRPLPLPPPEQLEPFRPTIVRDTAPDEAQVAPEAMGRLLAALGPDSQGSAVADALDRAERAMRGLPPIPREGAYRASQEAAPPPFRARTPMEGPDTGEENPNAGYPTPAGYFGSLKKGESSNNPTIRNKITDAGGLYQALEGTWNDFMRRAPHLGLTPEGRTSGTPEGIAQQERFGRHYTDVSMRHLLPALKRQPTKGELYALHFLGHGGGMQLLQNLDRATEEVVSPAAIASNPWLKSYVGKPARTLLGRLEKMME